MEKERHGLACVGLRRSTRPRQSPGGGGGSLISINKRASSPATKPSVVATCFSPVPGTRWPDPHSSTSSAKWNPGPGYVIHDVSHSHRTDMHHARLSNWPSGCLLGAGSGSIERSTHGRSADPTRANTWELVPPAENAEMSTWPPSFVFHFFMTPAASLVLPETVVGLELVRPECLFPSSEFSRPSGEAEQQVLLRMNAPCL